MSTAAVYWSVLALLLIALETLAPGVLFLWLGFAAAGVFLMLVLGLPLSVLAQILAFVTLSFVSVGIYWRYFRKAGESTDQPLLNRKQEQLLGRILVLESAIVSGRGRVQIGDTFWQVQGADAPQGAQVSVVAVDDGILKVNRID